MALASINKRDPKPKGPTKLERANQALNIGGSALSIFNTFSSNQPSSSGGTKGAQVSGSSDAAEAIRKRREQAFIRVGRGAM